MGDLSVVSKGETNALVAPVEDGVVLAHEDVTQDPERTSGGGDVKTDHTQQADLTIRDQVVSRSEGVDLAIDGEIEVRKSVVVACNHVLAGNDFLGTDLGSDLLNDVRRTSQEGSTRVNDGLGLGSEGSTIDGETTKGDLPVGSSQQVHPGEVTSELGLVVTTEGQLTEVLGGVTKVETELSGLNQVLLNQVLEGGRDVVDGEDREGKTQDTVELAELVSTTKTRGISDFGEDLVLDNKATHVQHVLGLEASNRARTVLNVESSTVLDVGGRLGGVILGVSAAAGVALGGSDPQVRATSVEDDLELLGRGTEVDGTVVLRVLVVVDDDVSVLGDTVGVAKKWNNKKIYKFYCHEKKNWWTKTNLPQTLLGTGQQTSNELTVVLLLQAELGDGRKGSVDHQQGNEELGSVDHFDFSLLIL